MKKIIIIIIIAVFLTACGNDDSPSNHDDYDGEMETADDDNSSDNEDTDLDEDSKEGEKEKVTVNFQLMDPSSNNGIEGILISHGEQEVESSEQGSVSVEIDAEKYFDIKGEKEGFQNYHFIGVSGASNFTFFTYVSSRSITQQVLGMLSQTLDTEKGFVVVGVDYKNMRPVYGAEVEIGSEHSEPFILTSSGMPKNGNILEDGGGSFISFPNTATGKTNVKVNAPEGVLCVPYPVGEGEEIEIDVYKDSVSVLAFVCEEE